MSHIGIAAVTSTLAMVVLANDETGDHDHLGFESVAAASQHPGVSVTAKSARQENLEKKYAARGEVAVIFNSDGSVVVGQAAPGLSIQSGADVIAKRRYQFDPSVLAAFGKACEVSLNSQDQIKTILFKKGGVSIKENVKF